MLETTLLFALIVLIAPLMVILGSVCGLLWTKFCDYCEAHRPVWPVFVYFALLITVAVAYFIVVMSK